MVTKRRVGVLLLLSSLVSVAIATVPAFNQPQPRPPLTPPPTTRVSQPTRAPQAITADECQGENLLLNPSFEGQYSAYVPPGGHPDCPSGICQTAQMAHGWTPYWLSHDPDDKDWIIRMPEYKPAEPGSNGPPRVRSGERGQAYFTFWSTHEAGFYQRVPAIPGALYCFSLWGHSWSSTEDNPDFSNQVLEQRLGIDPTGGANWRSDDIFWGPLQHQPDAFALFSVAAVAESNFITVYTYSLPDYPAKHNDVYWDDARLTVTINGGSLTVPDSLIYLADVDEPGAHEQMLAIELSGAAGLAWSASPGPTDAWPGGSLAVNPTSGPAGENPIITVDTTGLPVGTFTTTITVTSNIGLPGSPATVPVQVLVVPEVQEGFSPIITR